MTFVRFTVKRAIAEYLGEDIATIEGERRYQPTRTPCAVYTVHDNYLTATNGGRRPKEDKNYKWRKVDVDPHIHTLGWVIWEIIPNED